MMNSEVNKIKVENNIYKLKTIYEELVSYAKNNKKDNVEFKSSYDDNIPENLYGDSNHIKEILLNLLENAINCTNEGYISFTFNSILKDDKCKIIIIVEDSGIGIKEEDIDGLFNKNDNGFGLTSTKEILELMDGSIAVQSKYGEGSRFTLSIEQQISNEEPINYSNCNIMVVDDDGVNLKVAESVLSPLNINVTCLNSGLECIDNILEGNKYDLIILDDNMPSLDGIATLTNLKKIIGFDTPVIIFTSNIESESLEKYINEGFNDYLAKPIEKNKVIELLNRYITSSKTEKKEINKEDILKNSGVDLDKSLELLGDMSMYDDTIKEFYNESQTRLKNIEEYKNTGDMPNYAILVHAMKSDSKYLGFTKLAELSYDHEMASKSNDQNYVNEHYEELIKEANRILEIAKKYIGGN